MDTIDRSESNLPSPFPVTPPPVPVLPTVVSGNLATTPAQVNPRTLLRGLTRHWWQILLIWLVLSVPAVYLISQFVAPTYEAVSLLQVQPVSHGLYGQVGSETTDFRSVTPYLQTQVTLITTDRVLTTAITSPEIKDLSFIKKSEDSRAALRKNLVVEIVRDAYMIRVALEIANGKEAADIVNAVVSSYLAYNGDFKRGENRKLRASLATEREKIQTDITAKRAKLNSLTQKGTIGASKPILNPNAAKDDGSPALGSVFSSVTRAQMDKLADEMMSTDLELFKVESELAALESTARRDEKDLEQEESKQHEEQVQRRISEEFVRDPDIVALGEEIAIAKEQLDHAKSVARQANDPARRAAAQKYEKLMAEYEKQWQLKRKEIGQRLKAGTMGHQSLESINDLKLKLQSLKGQQVKQAEVYSKLKVDEKVANDDAFDAAFLNHELDVLLKRDEHINTNLYELDFKASQEDVRVALVDDAKAPRTATNNKRLRYQVAAPVALLFMVLGLFFLLEVKAERVADPDTLSTRMRSEVYALPPLPTARALRKLSSGPDNPIEQFLQRLDHLRFAVCGNLSELGSGRCVLITSAIGGEGKSTLAAQLAGRCGDAGMSALLIDADLRRSRLCEMLDVPEGMGLSDLLENEANATIDDVVVPVQGGTFYFLPAGTPKQDTNRIFQGPQLGVLITQLRKRYDLIIIDSPPVLPVPDALILGRWADGAVLAARYDSSRFPQVERARRQLDNAGIAIMGTVINGMRNADSYYGRYSYSRKRSSEPGSSEPI